MKAKNSDFKGGDKMDLNKINVFFNFLVANLVSILFLLGLFVVNVSVYKAFGSKYRTFMHWYNTDCYFVDFKS
ncbi:phi PVL orf 3-like protein [Staphylococcus aureus]|uniref:Phi PVL orf 3-like protein n=1 Tax=Staphylococcus aureus TaxID=1280 RepID=A0A380DK08_STAAU|nr:phi PVL orf 3-like protein [Staphylococcus aureus]